MRILLSVVAVLATLWSGYWFLGATAKEAVINTWLQDRKLDGWTVEFDTFEVVGFPNRFDSRFTNIKLADPHAGWSWQAPFFNILALSYKPNHIITVWPHSQVIKLAGEQVTVTSDEMIASVVFEPDTKLALDRTALRTTNLTLTGRRGHTISSTRFDFTSRQNEAVPLAHTLILAVDNLTPTRIFKGTLDPDNILPAVISRLRIDTDITFDAPWDRIAVERGLPMTQHIKLNDVSANWGTLAVQASGDLDVDSIGNLNGHVLIKIKNWRGVLSLAVSSGLFDRSVAEALETGLTLLTALSPDPTTLEAPLTFSNGRLSLGPVSLGAAPRLRRR